MSVVDINQLRQERAKVVADFRAYNEEVREKDEETAEDTEKFQRMNLEIEQLTKRIDAEETLLKHEADLARSAFTGSNGDKDGDGKRGLRYLNTPKPQRYHTATPTQIDTHMAHALQGWLRAMKPDADLREEHYEAAKFFNVNLHARAIELPISHNYRKTRNEYRDMSLTVGSGGYTVPEGFVNNLEVALLQHGGVRQVADVIRTVGGGDLPWPTMNDTSNKGAILAEETTFSTSTDPSFASIVFKAFKYSSKPIIVSNELLQDSAFDLAAMIGGWLGTRIGRIQNDHFTTGAGTTLPKGLTVAGSQGAEAASQTAITDTEVIDLEHSVDPAYRPNAMWMMHDAILAKVRKFKDATSGQYLWQPGMQAGVPDRLLGYRYIINQSMASATVQSAKVILFGDFSKYKIRDVASIRLVRLDELFAQTDQVGFVAFLRSDGNLLDAGTKPVKWLTCKTT